MPRYDMADTAADRLEGRAHDAREIAYEPADLADWTGGVDPGNVKDALDQIADAPGSGAHAILDGAVHSDSAADAVSLGSLIVGNATPKWDELPVNTNPFAIASPTKFFMCTGVAPGWLGINDLAPDGAPDGTTDYVATWDADASVHKQVLLDDLPGDPHTLLNDTMHSDAVGDDAVTRGSLIVGNATPAWDELVVGYDGQYLQTDGTDAFWAGLTIIDDTAPQLGAELDVNNQGIGDNTGTIDIVDDVLLDTDKQIGFRAAANYIKSGAADTLTLNGNTTLKLKIATSDEIILTAGKCEFEVGLGTNSSFLWSSGYLDAYIGVIRELRIGSAGIDVTNMVVCENLKLDGTVAAAAAGTVQFGNDSGIVGGVNQAYLGKLPSGYETTNSLWYLCRMGSANALIAYWIVA